MKRNKYYIQFLGLLLILSSLYVFFQKSAYFHEEYYFLSKQNPSKEIFQLFFYIFGLILSLIGGLFILLNKYLKIVLKVLFIYLIIYLLLEVPIYGYHFGHFHSFWESDHFH